MLRRIYEVLPLHFLPTAGPSFKLQCEMEAKTSACVPPSSALEVTFGIKNITDAPTSGGTPAK